MRTAVVGVLLALALTASAEGPARSLTAVSSLLQKIQARRNASALCPPRGFDSVPNFDIARYISAPWFVQQQVSPLC